MSLELGTPEQLLEDAAEWFDALDQAELPETAVTITVLIIAAPDSSLLMVESVADIDPGLDTYPTVAVAIAASKELVRLAPGARFKFAWSVVP